MALAVTLTKVQQIDNQVILWGGTVVFHYIGKQPLGTVGDRVFEEINRLVAAVRDAIHVVDGASASFGSRSFAASTSYGS